MSRDDKLDDVCRLDQMLSYMQTVPDIFQPTAFWSTFQQQNYKQILAGGLENFKRTINQNYFNWIPTSPDDNQFRALLRLTAEFPSVEAFGAEIGDTKNLSSYFAESPLETSNDRELYRIFVGMLWQYTKLSYPNGLIEALDEPTTGNPIPVHLRGKLISQDVANSIRERNVIAWRWEPDFEAGRKISLVEIGAGYGRLAYVFLRSAPVRYFIIDIPPALFVSQWYLSKLFTNKSIFKFRPWSDYDFIATEIDQADIAFLTPDQFSKLPDQYFHAGFTISSLAEMTHKQANMYLDLLSRKVRHEVYIKQWIESTNTLDGASFQRSDFDMSNLWKKTLDRVDTVQDRFFETLWVPN